MAATVHPLAVVDPDACLEDGVEIGPFCVVSGGAVLGKNTKLVSHVTISGNVRTGENNTFFPHCVVGTEPQDLGYKGAPTWVVIGNDNVFRESITIHRATTKELGLTSIGSHNYLMAGVHVGHDVLIGDHILIANNTMLCGHVHVHDYAALSGSLGVHQFVTIGSYSFVGGMSRVATDVPPFMLVEGHPSEIRCVNVVGLKRRGFSQNEVRALVQAHRLLYRQRLPARAARAEMEATDEWCAPVDQLFQFLDNQHSGRRGRGREGRKAA